ncbi:hypothetical protein H7F51_02545 [Novosphingobium flavum]|uniref:Uncharacterized protein n=1 Tax=Novosphingobium flavum TaxID=1778672 RepID=A0A7X1KKD3_9SPHN|nr:hypothetical protein [Novosphingobium flavum]MBC2664392.1 hypothetical protein [Novosphingobium flavum]
MKTIALFTLAASASLALSACGHSDDASDQATPDTVEMPAEEQLNTVAAEPVPDAGSTATAPADPNAGAKAEDAAANAAAAAADFNAAGGEGAEKAIDQAEKKM